MNETVSIARPTSAKEKLLDAALLVIRSKGYSAATVDDLCHAAGVTKGAFFHHFESKQQLAVAAAGHFASMADRLFSSAPYQQLPDPVDRLLAYVDFRKAILQGELPEFTCLLGTMVQEAYETHPSIREACDTHISEHAGTLAADISLAIEQRGAESGVDCRKPWPLYAGRHPGRICSCESEAWPRGCCGMSRSSAPLS